eukprot:1157321-Amorphochlora_amoeboformis.AAC.2
MFKPSVKIKSSSSKRKSDEPKAMSASKVDGNMGQVDFEAVWGVSADLSYYYTLRVQGEISRNHPVSKRNRESLRILRKALLISRGYPGSIPVQKQVWSLRRLPDTQLPLKARGQHVGSPVLTSVFVRVAAGSASVG